MQIQAAGPTTGTTECLLLQVCTATVPSTCRCHRADCVGPRPGGSLSRSRRLGSRPVTRRLRHHLARLLTATAPTRASRSRCSTPNSTLRNLTPASKIRYTTVRAHVQGRWASALSAAARPAAASVPFVDRTRWSAATWPIGLVRTHCGRCDSLHIIAISRRSEDRGRLADADHKITASRAACRPHPHRTQDRPACRATRPVLPLLRPRAGDPGRPGNHCRPPLDHRGEASRPAKAWPAWTSTRSAPGPPGTAGSPWPCSLPRSWPSPPRPNAARTRLPAG
jgi:hypothetical protein